MAHIIVALNVVLPVFLVIAIGWFFRWKKLINEEFVNMAMKVIFNACLPSMLFLRVSGIDISVILDGDALIFAGYVALMTVVIFFVARLIAKYKLKTPSQRGTFVQGSFRSNYVILGYSILYNMFGDQIIARMAILVIIIIPLYNLLAIWVLSEGHGEERGQNLSKVFKRVVTNPLIISIFLGFVASFMKIQLPVVVNTTMSMLGSIGTPLGLLGIGGYLNFKEVHGFKDALLASLLKVLVFPTIATLIAVLLGFTYIDASIVFVLFGSPAAISSFIMATALGGDGRLAANIVIISTGISMITFILGLTLLGAVY